MIESDGFTYHKIVSIDHKNHLMFHNQHHLSEDGRKISTESFIDKFVSKVN